MRSIVPDDKSKLKQGKDKRMRKSGRDRACAHTQKREREVRREGGREVERDIETQRERETKRKMGSSLSCSLKRVMKWLSIYALNTTFH